MCSPGQSKSEDRVRNRKRLKESQNGFIVLDLLNILRFCKKTADSYQHLKIFENDLRLQLRNIWVQSGRLQAWFMLSGSQFGENELGCVHVCALQGQFKILRFFKTS